MAQDTTPQIKYRIGLIGGGFMVMVAILLDCIQFFLTITGVLILGSELVTFAAGPMFGIWFLMMRVNYFTGNKAMVKMMSMLTTMVVELVPIVDAMPCITIGVISVIMATRAEDRESASKTNPT